MGAKEIIANTAKAVISAVGFIATFYAMIELMYFLSDPNYRRKPSLSKDVWLSTSWSLLVNMSLLSLFVLQHSLLATDEAKSFLSKYGLRSAYRSVYVILTAAVLMTVVKYWHDIPEVALWKFNMNFRPFWWLYAIIHVTAWLVIYIGNICMDVNELIGVKQVYYSIVNLPDPNFRKSRELQRLNSHIRHPSFLAFLLILWTIPVMSLDRLLLAVILTLYMYISWNTDERDYAYQKEQYIRKFHELERLRN